MADLACSLLWRNDNGDVSLIFVKFNGPLRGEWETGREGEWRQNAHTLIRKISWYDFNLVFRPDISSAHAPLLFS